MTPIISLREALADPALLGNVIPGDSWALWRAILIATAGEPLTADELALFAQVTGRTTAPAALVEEAAYVVGRRGGKDRAASVLAVYFAALCNHPSLAPGERGVAVLIGPDQRQAKITHGYIEAALRGSSVLCQLVTNVTQDTISLSNGIDIEVRAASFRRNRGVTAIVVIVTEIAFLPADESANPDVEILNALRPALATTGGPLVMISSPYAKRGELWDTFRRHYGAKGDPSILVVQGTSRTFNPTLSERVVARALERDYAAASAEYLAEFRSDLEAFVSREVVEACVATGVFERPAIACTRYSAFVDPAGGSGQDSMTLAIAHRERDRVILDCVRERRPPFSPEAVVQEFSAALKSYGVSTVSGDRWGGEWPRELLRKNGITYRVAEKTRSDFYRDVLPLLNSRMVDLLDNPRLVGQFCALERRTARSGKDSIDHAPGAHDDIANAVAGALVLVGAKAPMIISDAALLRFTKPVIQVDQWYRRAPSNGSPAIITGSRRGSSRQ